jgi:Zn-dependent protease with chaperone function
MSSNGASKFCSNGHAQPAAGTKFCIYCGAAVANIPPVHVQNNAQIQHTPQAVPQQYPQQPHQQYPVQPPYPQYQPYVAAPACRTCGGDGVGLPASAVFCRDCRWLRPLVPGYAIDTAHFAWAADAKAMAALRAITPLNAAAKAVSEKVGRRWIEVSFNGIELGEKQMPHIFMQAVRAARILGMPHMPDVYISGNRPWDCLTFGSDKDSFIVIGSAVAGNFRGVDLLYLLAREIGHCKAGHALWKTVIRFFLGEQGPAKGFMAGGVLANILSPTAMISGALEMPLLAWARQAEITADRAALIAVGSEDVARRSLLMLSLRSSFIFRQLNIQAWLDQQEDDPGDMQRLSELTTTSTPYLGPRLRLLKQFAASNEYQQLVNWIKQTLASSAPPKPTQVSQAVSQAKNIVVPQQKQAPPKPSKPAELKIKCSTCSTPMRIPLSALAGKPTLSVKCPGEKCGKLTVITKKPKTDGQLPSAMKPREENYSHGE